MIERLHDVVYQRSSDRLKGIVALAVAGEFPHNRLVIFALAGIEAHCHRSKYTGRSRRWRKVAGEGDFVPSCCGCDTARLQTTGTIAFAIGRSRIGPTGALKDDRNGWKRRRYIIDKSKVTLERVANPLGDRLNESRLSDLFDFDTQSPA
jgi:hypothetical protein